MGNISPFVRWRADIGVNSIHMKYLSKYEDAMSYTIKSMRRTSFGRPTPLAIFRFDLKALAESIPNNP
jgi:hypothetical protein